MSFSCKEYNLDKSEGASKISTIIKQHETVPYEDTDIGP